MIQEHIKKELANELLFGKLKDGGTVKVTVGTRDNGTRGLILEAIPAEAPVKPKKEEVDKSPSSKSKSTTKAKTTRKAPAKKTPPKKPDAEATAESDASKASGDEGEKKPAAKRSGTVPKVPRKK